MNQDQPLHETSNQGTTTKVKLIRLAAVVAVLLSGIILIGRISVLPPTIDWQTDFETSQPDTIEAGLVEFAQHHDRPLLLYFHADWCLNCIDLENVLANEFSDSIQTDWTAIRIDMTDSDKWEAPALSIFGVYGVPALAFMDRTGVIHKNLTLVGANPPRRALRSVLDQLPSKGSAKTEAVPNDKAIAKK